MNKEQNDGASSTPFDVRKIALAIAVLALIVTSAGILAIGTDSADGEDRSYTWTWTSGDCVITYECRMHDVWKMDYWASVQYAGAVLTISGDGKMEDYHHEPNSDWCNTPWLNRYNDSYPYFGHQVKVVVEEGVTHIGACSFVDVEVSEVQFSSTVTSIGANAFEKTKLKTISIPDTVTYIGEKAFYLCEQLTTVKLPNGIEKLNQGLFYKAPLDHIDIPSSVKSWSRAFYGSGLKSVTIPEGMAGIDDCAFALCGSLKTIHIPDSVTYIGGDAFTRSGITGIELGDNVTTLGQWAFKECRGLVSVILPPNLETVGKGVFQDCSSLQYVYIPNGLKTISESMFEGTALKTVILPNSIETIGDAAFIRTPMKYVNIPNSVKSIGSSAFGSTQLEIVVIPKSVEYIGMWAFQSKTKQYVTFEEGSKAGLSAMSFIGLKEFNVPEGAIPVETDFFGLKVTEMQFKIMTFYDNDKKTVIEDSGQLEPIRGYTWSTEGMSEGNAYKVAYQEPTTLTFTWVNWDGTLLQKDTNVAVKDWPPYKGDEPTNIAGLTFNGWNGIQDNYGNVIMIASFQPGELTGIGGDDGMGGDSEGGDADMDDGSGDHPKITVKSVLKFVRSLLRLWFR